MRDVESLICLFAMALFMNALDKRTYIPFAQAGANLTSEERLRQREMDLNSIPHIERRHCCYVRGLAFDLVGWFFNYYKLKGETIDPSKGDFSLLPVLIAVIARYMVRYKYMAHGNGIKGVCSASAFERQIKMSLFAFPGFEEEYKALQDKGDGKENPNTLRLPSVLEGLDLMVRDKPKDYQPIVDYFRAGKNRADNKYFFAVKGMYFITLLMVEMCLKEPPMQKLMNPAALLRMSRNGLMNHWCRSRKHPEQQNE